MAISSISVDLSIKDQKTASAFVDAMSKSESTQNSSNSSSSFDSSLKEEQIKLIKENFMK